MLHGRKGQGGWLAAVLLCLLALPGAAFSEDEGNALAAHIDEARLGLTQGLKIARAKGRPLAARFTVEDDTLRLAVVIATARDTLQLVIDPVDGTLRKTDAVTDPVALKRMRAAATALTQSAVQLEEAIGAAEQANEDSRVVAMLPTLVKGKAVARATLLRGTELSTVETPLR